MESIMLASINFGKNLMVSVYTNGDYHHEEQKEPELLTWYEVWIENEVAQESIQKTIYYWSDIEGYLKRIAREAGYFDFAPIAESIKSAEERYPKLKNGECPISGIDDLKKHLSSEDERQATITEATRVFNTTKDGDEERDNKFEAMAKVITGAASNYCCDDSPDKVLFEGECWLKYLNGYIAKVNNPTIFDAYLAHSATLVDRVTDHVFFQGAWVEDNIVQISTGS